MRQRERERERESESERVSEYIYVGGCKHCVYVPDLVVAELMASAPSLY